MKLKEKIKEELEKLKEQLKNMKDTFQNINKPNHNLNNIIGGMEEWKSKQKKKTYKITVTTA
jgi:DNA anti-recombination protein RmuC